MNAPTPAETEAIIRRAHANGILDEPPASDSEPPPEPPPVAASGHDVDEGEGAALLDEVLTALKTYVVLPSGHAYTAVVLWVACTHALAAFEHATRLAAVM